ncbi:MAG: YtxH domain-containing protein [Clostridiales bacterium]|nr:YtxH domain-containing protein [Clostridiales bacterium]
MCCNKNLIFAFLGGAIVGAGAALLFTPESGEDMRGHIKSLCRKYGLGKKQGEIEVERLVDEIQAEITEAAKK